MATVTESTPPTYRLTEEQQLLRDAVRTLADDRVAPRAGDIDRTGEFPQDLRELLAAQDILALPFPAEHGGLGADLLTICLAVEQLSRACATTGLILAVHELASLPLLLAGTDEQRARCSVSGCDRASGQVHPDGYLADGKEHRSRKRADPYITPRNPCIGEPFVQHGNEHRNDRQRKKKVGNVQKQRRSGEQREPPRAAHVSQRLQQHLSP